ncbi:hypothetical protein TL16_g10628 [Triparma laevis f. inornata]|uniref:Uncharacterized protein n=2 Tax=Triparma laevis TaxID=1534972 RepID=A0A9W7C8J4_9STRA|nr:hypothetical protein TL16_g10628 [Triparma laevis f. inornata]GMI04143.1 hypothetical protein TrLO_g10902 [Triparma laevis f. longispina]
MKFYYATISLSLTTTSIIAARTDEPITRKILNAMQQNSTGSDYPFSKWHSYKTCWSKISKEFDFNVLDSTDSLFSGFLFWGPTNAYYEASLTFCNAKKYKDFSTPSSTILLLAASFTSLGTGSAFFHGSATQLGNRIDNAPIGQIAITAHQVAVSSLGENEVVSACLPEEEIDDSIVNGTEVIKGFSRIFVDKEIEEWDQAILDLGTQFQNDYKVTFSCIVTTIVRIVLPTRIGTVLLNFLCTIFGFEQYMIDFLFNEYDAELQGLLVDKVNVVSGDDKKLLLKRGLGVLLKIGYAMFWQEELFAGPWLTSTRANDIGAFLQPFVNVLADYMTGYEHPTVVRTGHNIYPDCNRCRKQEPHSKWHEQSSVGLVDLVYLTDDVDILLRTGKLGPDSTTSTETDSDILSEQIAAFLKTDEAACLRNNPHDHGISCIGELWFGKGVFQNEFKCGAEASPAACLKDHITSHSSPMGQVISTCAQEAGPMTTEGHWKVETFSACVASNLPSLSEGDFFRFLDFVLN